MENAMKRAITAIALLATIGFSNPALAWGDREQGALAGIVGTLIFQHIQRDGSVVRQPAPVIVQQPPVIFQQPQVIYAPAPQQVIIQNPAIICPEGLASFYNQRTDRYGRTFYVFDGCR
jgi:hypothetical protein